MTKEKQFLEYKTKRTHKYCEFWQEENKVFVREGGINIEETTVLKEYKTRSIADYNLERFHEKLLRKGYDTPLIQLDILINMGVLGLEKLDEASDDIKKQVLKINGRAIKYISSPSAELIDVAIQSNGSSLEFIENPTEAMQLEAVKSNPFALKYIEHQTEAMKKIAMESEWILLVHRYFKNPTKENIISFMKAGVSLWDIEPYYSIKDLETAMQAIKIKPNNYGYLLDELQCNPVVAKQVLINDSNTITLIPGILRNSIDFLMDVLDSDEFMPFDYFLNSVNSEIRENKYFVIKVVSKNGMALDTARDSFGGDKDVVIAAISQNINALVYAKKKMYKVKEIKKIIDENKHKSCFMEIQNL
jgi:hypothetical protein